MISELFSNCVWAGGNRPVRSRSPFPPSIDTGPPKSSQPVTWWAGRGGGKPGCPAAGHPV